MKNKNPSPNEGFISVEEFAQYEGVSSKTLDRRISRGELKVTWGKGRKKYTRNRPQRFLHYTSLSSSQAQERFLRDSGLSLDNKQQEIATSQLTAKQRERRDRKEQALRHLSAALKDAPHGKKELIKQAIGKIYGFSTKTLERAMKDAALGGDSALIPAWSCGKRDRSILQEIDKFIDRDYMQELGPYMRESHERLCRELGQVISYSGYVQRINTRYTKAQQELVRNPDEWRKKYDPHVRRDWNLEKPNGCWVSDFKQIPVCCLFRDKPIFPWDAVQEDARSRLYTGVAHIQVPNALGFAQSYVYGVSKYGIPDCLYVDNDKSILAYRISGSKSLQTHTISPLKDFEKSEIPGIVRGLGTRLFFAAKYNAREKPIETSFKIYGTRLRHLPGFRGLSPKSRPKKLAWEIKNKRLLSFEELCQELDRIIDERNARPHRATGKAPISFYENHNFEIPSKEVLAFLLMDVHIVKVKDSLITIKGMNYRHDELWRLAGETAECRRDPKDLRQAAVIYKGELFCFASLEPVGHWRSAITLESVKTTARIRKKVSKWRKGFLENKGAIDDPLNYAAELDDVEKLRVRDIRPAASKVVTLHEQEKLARNIVRGLENRDFEEPKQEAINETSKPSIVQRLLAATPKETPKRPLRLVEHLTIDDPWDEED